MNLKIFKIISSIVIFLISIFTHYGYEIFPNYLTSFFFPVNESVFEHIKVILSAYLIYSIIEYIFLKVKNILPNNLRSNILFSITFNIFIFYLLYIPIYYIFKHNIVVTLTIYFISIFITQIISYKVLKTNKRFPLFENYFFIILLIYQSILIYFTYYPPKYDIFIDKNNNKIGLNNYY